MTLTSVDLQPLTQRQKSIVAQAVNILEFLVPVMGEGLTSLQIKPEDVAEILLDENQDSFTVTTIYGSNVYDYRTFKAAFNIAKAKIELLESKIEVDSVVDADFGTLYRVWESYHFLGTFYRDINGKWVAQPCNRQSRRFSTSDQAQSFVVASRIPALTAA